MSRIARWHSTARGNSRWRGRVLWLSTCQPPHEHAPERFLPDHELSPIVPRANEWEPPIPQVRERTRAGTRIATVNGMALHSHRRPSAPAPGGQPRRLARGRANTVFRPVPSPGPALESTARALRDAHASLVRAEYREMPGLSLSAEQIGRLWGLDRELTVALIEHLLCEGFLCRTRRDTYVRADLIRP